MPKPVNKEQLLAVMQKERTAFEQLLERLSPDEMVLPGALGEWSVKDVLGHLIEWEQMVLSWLAAGKRGETPHTPAEGFKWNELPRLNQHIYEKHRQRALEEVLSDFQDSYRQMQAAAQGMSEEELFTPGRYAWARQNTLAAYVNSSTGSHYRWARSEMSKRFK